MNLPIKSIIVVLGSPNSDNGELYEIAKDRCKAALEEYKKDPSYKLLLTGGYGEHFNTTDKPHAAYLKEYLIKEGVPESDIVEFAQSKNTIEDASLSKPIIEKYAPEEILVITSDYHLGRAQYVFEKEFKDSGINIEFKTVKTDAEKCGIDLQSQINHEKSSLAKWIEKDKAT
ncbi:MAG: YdcF family protein [Sedimentisphaeraceae bacterium JB056]